MSTRCRIVVYSIAALILTGIGALLIHFLFFSGIFIVIVMTGLDQDMMQKNLSCRNLREAQKNMYCYGFSFIPLKFPFFMPGNSIDSASGTDATRTASHE